MQRRGRGRDNKGNDVSWDQESQNDMEEGEGGVLLVGGGAGLVTGKLVIVGGVQVIEGVLIEGVDLAEE